MKNLESYLTAHPFLSGMDKKHIELIVGCARNERFNPGDYLFHEGDEAHRFYFVREGKLAMEVFRPPKGGIVFHTLGNSDVLGWSWLVAPYIRHFDCRAMELTRTISFDGNCLRTKCDEDQKLGYDMMKRFVNLMEAELMALRLQLLDIYDASII